MPLLAGHPRHKGADKQEQQTDSDGGSEFRKSSCEPRRSTLSIFVSCTEVRKANQNCQLVTDESCGVNAETAWLAGLHITVGLDNHELYSNSWGAVPQPVLIQFNKSLNAKAFPILLT